MTVTAPPRKKRLSLWREVTQTLWHEKREAIMGVFGLLVSLASCLGGRWASPRS